MTVYLSGVRVCFETRNRHIYTLIRLVASRDWILLCASAFGLYIDWLTDLPLRYGTFIVRQSHTLRFSCTMKPRSKHENWATHLNRSLHPHFTNTNIQIVLFNLFSIAVGAVRLFGSIIVYVTFTRSQCCCCCRLTGITLLVIPLFHPTVPVDSSHSLL